MNKLTRYEQSLSEQLKELPIPGVDQAWQNMKLLLEEDDDDKIILPPPAVSGCGVWSVLLLLLVAGIVLYFSWPQKWSSKKEEGVSKNNKKQINSRQLNAGGGNAQPKMNDKFNDSIHNLVNTSSSGSIPEFSDKKNDLVPKKSILKENDLPAGKQKNSNANLQPGLHSKGYKVEKNNKPGVKSFLKIKSFNKKQAANTGILKLDIKTNYNDKEEIYGNNPAAAFRPSKKNNNTRKPRLKVSIINPGVEDNAADSSNELITKNRVTAMPTIVNNVSTDTIVVIKKPDTLATVIKINTDTVDIKKNDSKRKKKFHVGVGVAINQAIPMNGAKIASVNNFGRKQALTDYIPSLYVRLYKEKKWFIQSEFRYGAPQYTKEYIYKSKLKIDTFQVITRSSYALKKTYYHQLPLSFNYLILPGWSIGTGIIYNKFTGTVSEETIRRRIPGTILDTLVSIKIINDKKDSSFVKNSFQWLVETQYKWRRLSIGARYAQGLQPYIHYTDPVTNLPASKKNNALYVFLRYEIWNSRKNMVGYRK